MMQGYEMMSGWGGMWLGPLFMFLVPLIVIGLIVWAIRAVAGSGRSSVAKYATSRQILDERFAKGEIDEDDYDRRRNALEQ